ncbi:MAG: ABC transporter permease [Labilithrix sp.]|nr:ABC transporter permease [Labilithrix sp.]MCW5814843.1 ABC transporter permease [Labilithrix sp.]
MAMMLRAILLDARFAARMFRRSRALTATVLFVLVVGIGGVAAAFSFLAGFVLRPLPFPRPSELTMMWQTQPFMRRGPLGIADFEDWREESKPSFTSISAMSGERVSLVTDDGAPEPRLAAVVSGEYFETLEVRPLAGRLFARDDERVGGARVAVIGADLWREKFGADPHVAGRTMRIDAERWTILGVAPELFRGGSRDGNSFDLWLPLAVRRATYAEERDRSSSSRGRYLHVIGRRRPGVTIAQAERQMSEVARRLAEAHPTQNAQLGVFFEDLQEALAGSTRASVWLVFAACAFVYLIACANIANLLLAHASTRRTEMALRSALGASRRRLVLQVLVETTVVFTAGALGGTILAYALVGVVDRALEGVVGFLRFGVDGLVLAFTIALAAATAIVVGLVPALSVSRVAPQIALKESEARAPLGRAQRTLRNGFVVTQVALAFALLAGTGIALRSYRALAATSPGFDGDHVVTAQTTLPAARYPRGPAFERFYTSVVEKLAATPGIEAAAATSSVPCHDDASNSTFDIEGRPPFPPTEGPLVFSQSATPQLFTVLRIPLLRGRLFDEDDFAARRSVVVVNKAFATRFFPQDDAVGHRITLDTEGQAQKHWWEVVGVVGDVRQIGLGRDLVEAIYFPSSVLPLDTMSVVARSSDERAAFAAIDAAFRAVDPELAITNRRSMRDVVSRSIGPERSFLKLVLAAGVLALVLATLGVLAVVGYTTAQRTREIAVRMALGATPARVVLLVLRDALRLVAIGLVFGLGGAFVLARLVAERVAVKVPLDAMTLAAIAFILFAAGALAALVPALRAARIDPVVALK